MELGCETQPSPRGAPRRRHGPGPSVGSRDSLFPASPEQNPSARVLLWTRARSLSFWGCSLEVTAALGNSSQLCSRRRHSSGACHQGADQSRDAHHCPLPAPQDDFLLIHYDKGPCRNKLGHSRASVIWHRTQVRGGSQERVRGWVCACVCPHGRALCVPGMCH